VPGSLDRFTNRPVGSEFDRLANLEGRNYGFQGGEVYYLSPPIECARGNRMVQTGDQRREKAVTRALAEFPLGS
jgi:hypothetical protein